MRRGPDVTKCSVWRRRIGRFDRRQETVGQFCEREQVSVANYYHWRRKLAEMAKSRGAQATPKTRGTQSTRTSRRIQTAVSTASPSQEHESCAASALQFLPLEITGPAPRTTSRVEVLLPGGVRVSVPCHETAALETVLAALRQRPSEEPAC